MAKPRIRHIAIFVRDPVKVAQFYRDVFDMELIHTRPSGEQFVSDGHINLAILPHRTTASAAPGINHIGFHVDSIEGIRTRYPRPASRRRKSGRPTGPMPNSAAAIRKATCSTCPNSASRSRSRTRRRSGAK